MSGLCGCKITLLLLACWLFGQFLLAVGHVNLTPEACSLIVSHGPPQAPTHGYSTSVKLVDANTLEEHACYSLNTKYYITIQTDAPTIKGFIMLHEKSRKSGDFGDINVIEKPTNMGYGLCGTDILSVCHDCGDSACNYGKTVQIPYRSPNTHYLLEFNYTVVFEYGEYIENQMQSFPPCRPTPQPTEVPTELTPATTSKPHVCNITNFNLDQNPQMASNTCGNNIVFISDIIHKDKGKTYDCRYTDMKDSGQGVKRVDCFSGCTDPATGKVLCCKNRSVKTVSRNFMCTPRTGGHATPMLLDVTRGSRCECYPCEDVCSEPTTELPTDNPNAVNRNHSEESHQTNRIG